ncbi:MAG: preprotein translocase subunit SecA [Pseudomonadales bacterium]|nr:preprotein translocase subunit SecA [Gammaproteobacteria bacterium]MCS5569151.1 preprotein translocase subunit SecA [Pseudomonadales bacterium]|tara:strand:+ start:1670 stop:4450 length:2781 start_codon:yes stop_codon:yes gene_type:complete
MFGQSIRNLFGTRNSRELKRMEKMVARINGLGADLLGSSIQDLKCRTAEFRERHQNGESLDALLPEAFACVREVAERVSGTRHYDVQLIGGITLHEGGIAEMRTGEGKTLVATLAAYLNALTGNGVHIVTVNDYLARRDADWMGPIYAALDMTVGVVQSGQDMETKRAAYAADITYGTNNEFGFDYLRDNMAFRKEDRLQRQLSFAIVDEVDSILIDEARTPLIISGPAEESTDLYRKINKLAPKLVQQEQVEVALPAIMGGEEIEDTGDFFVDEKNRQVELTERGHLAVEDELKRNGMLGESDSLYAASNLGLLHHVQAALKAHFLFKRDVDYMVRNDEIVIVDEHTGRAQPGRRWSDGIHQAVEAKEGVSIQNETQTVASTTFQNYFRLYGKLSGMTGTADTEAFEFKQIYGLDVVVIPTNVRMIREDRTDLIYLTVEEKFEAIVDEIRKSVDADQPVLVGTASIESSERIASELNRAKISHNVLNAKQHESEAEIIAQAGRPGAVTIATNMAGRGTDIVLGGNWQTEVEKLGQEPDPSTVANIKASWQETHDQVVAAGGLHIVGTERHESRRIDNQLRGRAGRQGDPGSSRFFISWEDNLLRIFGADRARGMLDRAYTEKGEAVEGAIFDRSIERAQRKVEGRNFDIRKNLLEYDDVANDQRTVIYQQRNELMEAVDIREMLTDIRTEIVDETISDHIPPESIVEQWDIPELEKTLVSEFNSAQLLGQLVSNEDEVTEDDLRRRITEQVQEEYEEKVLSWNSEGIDMNRVEKEIMLNVLDQKWKEHLGTMDHLRQGIHLRAYAQKQPKQEYKRESFELFQEMLYGIKRDVIRILSRVELDRGEDLGEVERKRRLENSERMQFQGSEAAKANIDQMGVSGDDVMAPTAVGKPQTFVREDRKVGRNEKCPCGSGKKYKQCHGRAA